jgi:hypothetical protein
MKWLKMLIKIKPAITGARIGTSADGSPIHELGESG